MAIGTHSYGSTIGTAALVPRWASSGDFTTTTRPTLAQAESWIDQVSGMLNAMLARAGFTIPISDDDVKDALDLFVNQEAAAMADGVNGSGKFGPTAKAVGKQGRFNILMEDVQDFIEAYAVGFERLGAERTTTVASGIGYRNVDESGDEIHPIFQREGFGNVFSNWDSD